MILVDIYIPAMESNYDFMLDENAPLYQVMTEISEMLSKKVMGSCTEQMEDFLLCSVDTRKMLEPGKNLYMNGISDGSKLILV